MVGLAEEGGEDAEELEGEAVEGEPQGEEPQQAVVAPPCRNPPPRRPQPSPSTASLISDLGLLFIRYCTVLRKLSLRLVL